MSSFRPRMKKRMSQDNGTTPYDLQANPVEYSVYIHHPANENRKTKWERTTKTRDKHKALNVARGLHLSQKYARVEVKRRYYDPVNHRKIGQTYKVFDHLKKRSNILLSENTRLVGITAAFIATAAYFFFM